METTVLLKLNIHYENVRMQQIAGNMMINNADISEAYFGLVCFFTKKEYIFYWAFINKRVYFAHVHNPLYLASHNQLLIELKCFTGTSSIK